MEDRGWDINDPEWTKQLWLQCDSDTDDFRTQLFMLYAFNLQQCGVTDLGSYFKALAHDFSSRGLQSTAKLLSSQLVLVARRGSYRKEVRARAQSRELGKTEKDAVSGRMLMSLYEVEWVNGLSSCHVVVIDQAVACLIGWFLAQFGLRISNLARTESLTQQLKGNKMDPVSGEEIPVMMDQHVIRAGDVSVQLEGMPDFVTAWEFNRRSNNARVIGMVWTFWSSKSNQDGKRMVRFQLTNQSEGEKKLLNMLVVFVGFAQFGSPDDIFFSRLHAGLVRGSLGNPSRTEVNRQQRYVYTQKDVNDVVKACATRCNLDPGRFSTKSFKNLGISTLQNNREELNMSEKEVAILFDHSSVGSNRHYQRKDMYCGGPLAFLENGKLYDHENLVFLDAARRSGLRGDLSAGSTSSSG